MNQQERLNFWGQLGFVGSFVFCAVVVGGMFIPHKAQLSNELLAVIGGLAVAAAVWARIMIPVLNRRYERRRQKEDDESAKRTPSPNIRAIT